MLRAPPKDAPPWNLFEKASLIDASANKQWIAYITEDPSDNIKYLRIHRFKISDTVNSSDTSSTVRVDSYSAHNSGTISEDPEKFDLTEYIRPDSYFYYFLSISPTGKRVPLSFIKINRYGEVETQQRIHNPDTIIFKVGSANNRIRKAKRIKFQGSAVFLKYGNLALINKQVLEIYDCQRHYRKIHWFNLYSLTATRGSTTHEAIVDLESLVKTSYVHFDPHRIHSAADLKDIIRISKHIRHNVLTTNYHSYVSRVWSIIEDGVRLTSFHSLSMEEIMAFSLDYKYLATFVERDKSINIYNVKSGLVVSRLKQDKTVQSSALDDDSNNDFHIYVCFCHKSQYLTMVSIGKLREPDSNNGNNALITFQVWNIIPEKSIYCATEEIRIDWDMKDKFIQPFVDEEIRNHDPEFRVVYSTTSKSGIVEIKVKELDIFNSQVYNNREQNSNTISRSSSNTSISGNVLWQDVPSAPCSTRMAIHEERSYIPDLDNDLNDYNKLTCFQRNIGGRSYLLRFGKKTVQLWQVLAFDKSGRITAEDKLIYIRAFKTPFYGFNDAYKENGALVSSVNCFQDGEEGRIVISIIRDKGVMDESIPYVMTATAYSDTPDDAESSADVYYTLMHLLLSSTQKLSYLQINKRVLTILTSEVGEKMHMSTLHKDLVPDLRDLESHSTREQVTKYSNRWLLQGWLEHFYYWWSLYVTYYCKQEFKKTWTQIIMDNFMVNFFKKDTTKINGSLIKLCVVPLPHFNSYSDFPEDRDNRHQLIRCNTTEYTHFPEYRGYLASCLLFLSLQKNENEDNITVIPYKSERALSD